MRILVRHYDAYAVANDPALVRIVFSRGEGLLRRSYEMLLDLATFEAETHNDRGGDRYALSGVVMGATLLGHLVQFEGADGLIEILGLDTDGEED